MQRQNRKYLYLRTVTDNVEIPTANLEFSTMMSLIKCRKEIGRRRTTRNVC